MYHKQYLSVQHNMNRRNYDSPGPPFDTLLPYHVPQHYILLLRDHKSNILALPLYKVYVDVLNHIAS